MSEYKYKDGNRCRITEYETRILDMFGDSQDVTHFESRIEAENAAEKFIRDGATAVVVEKHIRRYPAHCFDQPDKYIVIFTSGNDAALREGGWK